MIVHVLFMQRKESYGGEFGPEALEAIDEYTYDENPEHFDGEVEKAKVANASAAAGFALVQIVVDGDEIRKRCLNQLPPVMGKIL